MKDFLSLAKDRYSVRAFSDKPVPDDDIKKIIEAALCAPTAVNYQPFRVWVLKSAEARAKAASATKFGFAAQAPVMFAVGANASEAWVRKYDDKNFAEVDASIAATQMMLEIHDLGLGTTWVGHFDQDKLKELFPEMKDYSLIALFPTGYPSEDAAPSQKHSESRAADDIVNIM